MYTAKEAGRSANPMAQALRASPVVSPFDCAGNVLNDFVPGQCKPGLESTLADLLPGQSLKNVNG
jgi:hypothetical protein